jgi:DNA-binding protein HU-beta
MKRVCNKADLVGLLADRAGISKAMAESALTEVVAMIQQTVAAGGEVNVAGLGKFCARARAARKGLNLRTREFVSVPPTTVPFFVAGAAFKRVVAARGVMTQQRQEES